VRLKRVNTNMYPFTRSITRVPVGSRLFIETLSRAGGNGPCGNRNWWTGVALLARAGPVRVAGTSSLSGVCDLQRAGVIRKRFVPSKFRLRPDGLQVRLVLERLSRARQFSPVAGPLYPRCMVSMQTHRWIDRTRRLWCRLFHDQPMWPVSGRYQCRVCLIYHDVCWEKTASSNASSRGAVHSGLVHRVKII
jgi:hypothetical protein